MHIHLSHESCFEVVVLDGDGKEIAKLAEAMMTLKGVSLSRLSIVKSNGISDLNGVSDLFAGNLNQTF